MHKSIHTALRRSRYKSLIGASVALSMAIPLAMAQDANVLRVSMHAGLRTLDPNLSTVYIARDYGYMVYDTLFSLDEQLHAQPQMVDHWEVSDDDLTYTFTLRDGLAFHDGAPVTSSDVIASLQRWGKVDGMGISLFSFVDELVATDASTFQIILKEPYGLVIDALAKPSSYVPFIMPERVALTPPSEQIEETIGSGPFRMVMEEYVPGVTAVFEKNEAYVPRSEPANGLAGGKVVHLDRVEWTFIGDPQMALNALTQGEIDVWETPTIDLLPMVQLDSQLTTTSRNLLGNIYFLRMNWLQPPLDNQKIRQAILNAVAPMEDYLMATAGDPEYYQACGSMYGCGTPLENEVGAVQMDGPDIEKAKQLLAEGGYAGEPITIINATGLELSAMAPVTVQALREIGMTVDLQSMDWSTMISRRNNRGPVSEGGWHIFHSGQSPLDQMNPILNNYLRGQGGDEGFFGWPEDPEIEALRAAYVRETDAEKQRDIALQIQARAYDTVAYIPLGQTTAPVAHRNNVSGWVIAAPTVFWNVEKQ